MERIRVGTYVNTHGIRGEIKIKSNEDTFDHEEIFLERGPKGPLAVTSVRKHKNLFIVKLEGIDDINAIEPFKGAAVYAEKQAIDEPDTYYVSDLVGAEVITIEEEYIGRLKDVLTETAQPLYVISGIDGGEYLLPGVKAFIVEIDLEKKRIVIDPPEGWMA